MQVPEVISRAQALQKGLKRYFTGKPCKRGHLAERYITGATCCKCVPWVRNKDAAKVAKKSSAKHNRDAYNRSRKRWAERNPQREAEQSARWYKNKKIRNYVVSAARAERDAGHGVMSISEAIDVFKSQDNAFEFLSEDNA